MKKIKIKFVDFGKNFNQQDNDFTNTLRKRYEVEISDKPDYIFFSNWGRDYLNYRNCVRIFFTNENLVPDFNVTDYGIAYSHINIEDRYIRIPFYLLTNLSERAKIYARDIELAKNKHIFDAEIVKKEKKEFCSFIYAHTDKNRDRFFNELSKYKKVNSGGGVWNNIGERVVDKVHFDSKHKFVIACENGFTSGYTTEKIMQAFAARTIPIYWGNPSVTLDYNEKAFINCNEKNIEDVIEIVKRIDQNDEEYYAMLREPAFASTFNIAYSVQKDLEKFLYNIFDQEKEKAFRRNRIYLGYIYELKLRRGKIADEIFALFTARKFRNWIHRLKRFGFKKKLKF